VSKQSNPKHLILFDFIEKHPRCDKNDIRIYFKKIEKKLNLETDKEILYRFILKKLTHLKYNFSTKSYIRNLLNQAEILFSKDLYKHAAKIVLKAKRIAYSIEDSVLCYSAYELERLINIKMLSQKDFKIYEKNMRIESKKILEALQIQNTHYIQFNRLTNLLKKDQSLTSELINHFKQYDKIAPYRNFNLNKTTNNILMYYSYNAYKAFYTYNFERLFIWSKKYIDYHEKHIKQKDQIHHNYITMIHTFILSCSELNKSLAFKKALVKVERMAIAQKYPANLLRNIIESVIIFYGTNKKYTEGMNILIEHEATFKLQESKFSALEFSMVSLNIAQFYFEAKSYEQSIEWLNIIFKQKTKDISKYILANTHVLNVMAHFELGNNSYTENLLIRSIPFLKTNRFYVNEVDLCFQYIRNYLDNNKKVNKATLEKLQGVQLSPEKIHLNLIGWLEEKI